MRLISSFIRLCMFGFLAFMALTGYLVCFGPSTDSQLSPEMRELRAERAAKAEAQRIERAAADAEREAEREARAAADAARPQMNAANFAKLREGMTYDEVIAIVGKPDELVSSSSVGGIRTEMYSWKAGLIANANAMFQNGKMVSKAQFGL